MHALETEREGGRGVEGKHKQSLSLNISNEGSKSLGVAEHLAWSGIHAMCVAGGSQFPELIFCYFGNKSYFKSLLIFLLNSSTFVYF